MKPSLSKSLLMTTLITGSVLLGTTSVFAEELGEFSLDQMIVTATRTEKKDIDIPAIVEVFDEEKIEKSNAANAYDVLQNALGVNSQSQGFNGTSMGSMTSKIMIRGVELGTLVLVNGVPMNQDGKYNLEDIPAESIEKIELVKGGGSVLYGSEATGGVINIITKKTMPNKIKVSAGNFGKERYNLSMGTKKFGIVAGLENRGHAGNMSEYVPGARTKAYYDYGKGERKSVLWNWEITDGLKFTHNYSKNKHQYWQRHPDTHARILNYYYEDEDNMFLLGYDKDGWKANLSYGTQEKTSQNAKFSKGVLGSKTTTASRKGHNTNLDVQKEFELGKNKLLVGTSYQKEDMDLNTNSSSFFGNSNYKRDNYSIYMSYDWQLSDSSNLIINARETWAKNIEGKQTDKKAGVSSTVENDSMSKFTPEIQYIVKFDDNRSFYAKAGKSFRMPNLTQIYGTGSINPKLDLKPEQGTHYEIGYKENIGKSSLKFAVFNYKIKDSIDPNITNLANGEKAIEYFNQDIRNTGAELSYNINHDEHFSSNWGMLYQRPQAKNAENYGDNEYHKVFNRYQLQGGVNYVMDKFAANMTANFVGDRTSSQTSTKSRARHLKPQLFTDLHFSYAPEKNQKAFLHINNVFDRKDITTNSSSNFLSLGINFMLGYEYSF